MPPAATIGTRVQPPSGASVSPTRSNTTWWTSPNNPPTERYGLVGGTIDGLRFELYDFREDGRSPSTAWIVYLPPGAPPGFVEWSHRRRDAKPVGPLIESVTVADRSIMNVCRGWRSGGGSEEELTGPLRILARVANRYTEDP